MFYNKDTKVLELRIKPEEKTIIRKGQELLVSLQIEDIINNISKITQPKEGENGNKAETDL